MKDFRLLIVDDEEEYVTTMVERMEIRGIHADGVFDCTQALEKLQAKKYDVVLLDYKMPGLSGIKAIEKIYNISPDIKIFLITGYGTNLDGETKIQHLVQDTLPKPIDIENLITCINESVNE